MRPPEAVARAVAAITKAEDSPMTGGVAQIHLQAADRWLQLAIALADNGNLIDQIQVGAAK